MEARGKRVAQQLGLLLAACITGTALHAAEPPAGTVTGLDNVGLFDGSSNVLTTCVALQNADGTAQLDANGKARVYDATLSLDRANLVFKVTAATPYASTKDCSGVYRSGVYTDSVLITNLAPAYNGKVWNLTLDVLNAAMEFKLRLDGSFAALRVLSANTTQLGSDLGDFRTSATREYGTANMPAMIALKLPQCSDPQGDENSVVIVKDGVVLSTSGVPGGSYGWSTSGAAAGEHKFQTYCSDEVGVRALAQSKGLTFAPSYIADSANAAGTLTLKIVQGTVTTPTVGEITFNFAASTTASDQELIRDTVLFARDFLQTTFGRALQKNVTITTSTTSGGCVDPGSSAFTGPQTMMLCIGNRGWTDHGPVVRRKILIHEVFHLLQFELRWIGGQPGSITGPHWLIEGSAEYVGWLGMAAQGHVTLDVARGCMLKEVADFALRQPPGLGNLGTLESPATFGPGPVYPLSMIGTDQLVARTSASALLTYGNALVAGNSAAASFSTAFGMSLTDFYAQFPAYRSGLAVPADYACRI